ncbi:hypothetical protein RQCS_61420 (plasmid) [Rhodococcus qingshengii]|uniref:hypothetical protein n=1 Tax=Rhodococcus qingshengii TaxID=334542 RepID=UPI0007E54378|nr:hypothetical protein [Rhodococcus qingshengii]BCF86597.1 hypothetical protein RQCS_61420 [Rhodococcus qingshengii]
MQNGKGVLNTSHETRHRHGSSSSTEGTDTISNPPTASTLIATNLRKSFHIGRRQPTITAVDDVSFTISPGESLGLVG